MNTKNDGKQVQFAGFDGPYWVYKAIDEATDEDLGFDDECEGQQELPFDDEETDGLH